MENVDKELEYIRTFSGKNFYIFNPNKNDVDIVDIAHSLSMQCRFNSHTPIFYSVASHSIIGSKLIAKPFKLEFLTHDFAEAYTGDCVTPIKRRLTEWGEFEKKIEQVISDKYNLPYPMSKEVKDMDNLMLRMELCYLMGCETDEIFPMTKEEFLKEINHTHKQVAGILSVRFKHFLKQN